MQKQQSALLAALQSTPHLLPEPLQKVALSLLDSAELSEKTGGDMNMHASVELSRLFSLMDGIQADDLFAGMGGLSTAELPPAVLNGLNGGLGLPEGPSAETASGAGDAEEQGSAGTGPSLQAGADRPLSPRTLYRIHQPPTIERGSCTKICPASSSSPKYKFVVPNDFVSQYMQHLVEKPFKLVDGVGGSWDCHLIQRKNKEKYEYMIQGWRRYGEDMQIMEGDTVQFCMVGDSSMQVSIIKRGAAARAKGLLEVQPPVAEAPSSRGGAPTPASAPAGSGLEPAPPGGDLLTLLQHQQELAAMQAPGQQAAVAAPGLGGGMRGGGMAGALPGGGAAPNGTLPGAGGAVQPGGMDMATVLEHLSKRQRLNEAGLAAAVEPPPPQAQAQGFHQPAASAQPWAAPPVQPQQQGGQFQPPQPPHFHQLQRWGASNAAAGGEGAPSPPGAAAPAAGTPGGAGGNRGPAGLPLLSDVADFDALLQENMALREELRLAQQKVTTLENGVLNIKAVLTKNSDPGLIAITGVLNLVNHIEQPEFLPELTPEGRNALSSACVEIRRHLSSVVRMAWLLRECSQC